MKKLTFMLLLSLLLVLVIAGCSGNKEKLPEASEQKSSEQKQNEEVSIGEKTRELARIANSGEAAVIEGEPMIGMVMPGMDQIGWLGMYGGVVKGALVNNAGLMSFSANYDTQAQLNIIEDLITKGVDGILIDPQDSAAMKVAVEKATNAGIPVAVFDNKIFGADDVIATYVVDNYKMGVLSARVLEKWVDNEQKLKILKFQGNMASANGQARDEGFQDEIDKHPNWEVVSTIPTDWMADKANAGTFDAFQAHPDINMIYCPSDLLIPPVLAALQQLDKLKLAGDPQHIYIVGIDGQPIAHEKIREGYVDATISQPMFQMGQGAYEALLKYIQGKDPGPKEVVIDPIVVTKENVDDPELWGNKF